ncbi:hypothetical protein ACFLWZ_05625 [Chloroflexota bacterium]
MEQNGDLILAAKEIKNVADNTSWFRDSPHRWADASLPLAYATACVEIVSQMSEKAGAIYQQIIEAYGKPGIKTAYDKIMTEISDAEKEKIKEALLHPEIGFLSDPNKPFKDLEDILSDDELSGEISLGDDKETKGFKNLYDLILEFITIGFNRESDIAKGKLRVMPNEKSY